MSRGSGTRDKPRIVLAGPGPGSKGGISAAISTLLGSELSGAFDLRWAVMHRDGPSYVKLAQAARGYATVMWELVVRHADLIWIHSSYGASFRRKAVVTMLTTMVRRPFIFHVHGSDFVNYYERSGLVERWLVRRVFTRAACVIALSPAWGQRLTTIAPRARVECVMNPVDLPEVDRAVGRAAAIVSLGRVSDRKGSFVLIEAFSLFAAAYPTARLVLAGDGEVERARDLANARGLGDRVDVPGWMSKDECQEQLRGATVFVLASRDEGLPVALLEAMASSVPCIATPVGGIPDVLEDNANGFLVPVDDPVALADRIRWVLDNPETASDVGRRARASALSTFATPRVASQLDAIIRDVLARQG
jgi:glycosyltransferase involved in cell wall biosynthesis